MRAKPAVPRSPNLARASDVPRRYEADNGPLSREQLRHIDKLVPQGRLKAGKRLFSA